MDLHRFLGTIETRVVFSVSGLEELYLVLFIG